MKRLPYILMVLAAVFSVAMFPVTGNEISEKKSDESTRKKTAQSNVAKKSAPSAAQIQLWIKELDDQRFLVREVATRELLKVGRPVIPVVTKALKSSSAEVRKRARFILGEFEKKAEEKSLVALTKFGVRYRRNDDQRVYEIILEKTNITDDALKHIKQMTQLEKLMLKHTNISDAGLAHCSELKRLRVLSLGFTQVTDAGLKNLTHFKKMQGLDLDHTMITNKGMAHLKDLTNLKSLILSNTKISDAGMAHLAVLKNLTILSLYGTYAGDVGLAHLKGIKTLQKLDLQLTQVTDVGLKHLEGLSRLEILYLSKNRITDRGIKDLQAALPECEIDANIFSP